MHNVPVRVFCSYLLLYRVFSAIELKRWKIFSIGHRFETVAGTANANELFNVRIPWSNVLITYRPFFTIAWNIS